MAEKIWLARKDEGWAVSVGILSGASLKHPQSAYARLQKSLHQEWAWVQRVTPVILDDFDLVEKALRETFLPPLFNGLG